MEEKRRGVIIAVSLFHHLEVADHSGHHEINLRPESLDLSDRYL